MQVETMATQQLSANVMDGGEQKAAFFASFRAQNVSVNLDVIDAAYCAEHKAGVSQAFDTFVAQALAQAAACGAPVNGREPTLEGAAAPAADYADADVLMPAT